MRTRMKYGLWKAFLVFIVATCLGSFLWYKAIAWAWHKKNVQPHYKVEQTEETYDIKTVGKK